MRTYVHMSHVITKTNDQVNSESTFTSIGVENRVELNRCVRDSSENLIYKLKKNINFFLAIHIGLIDVFFLRKDVHVSFHNDIMYFYGKIGSTFKNGKLDLAPQHRHTLKMK